MIRFSSPFRLGRRLAAGLGALATALAAVSQPAAAIEPLIYKAIASHAVPACQEEAVLSSIRSKFSFAELRIDKRDLSIATVDRIHQAYEGHYDPSPVYRRYCEARVSLSNGKHATMYYLVEQDAGFVGATWNVEFCVPGYERWFVHDGRCHTVRHRWW